MILFPQMIKFAHDHGLQRKIGVERNTRKYVQFFDAPRRGDVSFTVLREGAKIDDFPQKKLEQAKFPPPPTTSKAVIVVVVVIVVIFPHSISQTSPIHLQSNLKPFD